VNIELIFAPISFWFYFEDDVVAIKAEHDPRTCACQGIDAGYDTIQFSVCGVKINGRKINLRTTPDDANAVEHANGISYFQEYIDLITLVECHWS
jgi:hypothetical protein